MDLDRLERIKKLVIIALFSDDELMEMLVFKGGNAVDLIHGVAMRGSIDLDFSLESDFAERNVQSLQAHFDHLLNTTFRPEGLRAFDVTFERRPRTVSSDLESFWGGYRLQFKVIGIEVFETHKGNLRRQRTAAEAAGPRNSTRFRVEFSRHEYCASKEERELDGYKVYVYTPVMIVCEKIRAICQQMLEYRQVVRKQYGAARARDFFDIYVLLILAQSMKQTGVSGP